MNNGQSTQWQALAVVKDPIGAAPLLDALGTEGMTVTVLGNVAEALAHCRKNHPDLVVVEDQIGSDSGVTLINELLSISWTTATILISPEPEEEVHERTEGLGILGFISDYADREGLHRLLTNLRSLKSA